MPRHPATNARLLIGAGALLGGLSLLPSTYGRWVGAFGNLASIVVAPIGHPVHTLALWLAPRRDTTPDDPERATLQDELERERTLRLALEQRVAELQAQVQQLRAGMVDAGLGYETLLAPVIGASSDPSSGLLQVKAGRNRGLEINTVAVVGSSQLCGLVREVGARTAWITPITSKSSGAVDGLIIVDETVRLACSRLFPQGDGTLKGQVERRVDPSTREPILARVGQEVRLDSRTPVWPRTASMLVIGTITRIDTLADGRQVVTVEPVVPLDRVREVWLRLVRTPDEGKDGSP